MRRKDADRCRANQKIILIEFGARLVVIEVITDLCCVTRPDEVLAIVIGDDCVLMPVVECIEKAVGVFFRLIYEYDVELVAVGVAVAEETNHAVGVGEYKSAKVANKELRPGPHGREIII